MLYRFNDFVNRCALESAYAERRALVIGSQCEHYGERLLFLPGVAEELYRVMTDGTRGVAY